MAEFRESRPCVECDGVMDRRHGTLPVARAAGSDLAALATSCKRDCPTAPTPTTTASIMIHPLLPAISLISIVEAGANGCRRHSCFAKMRGGSDEFRIAANFGRRLTRPSQGPMQSR